MELQAKVPHTALYGGTVGFFALEQMSGMAEVFSVEKVGFVAFSCIPGCIFQHSSSIKASLELGMLYLQNTQPLSSLFY